MRCELYDIDEENMKVEIHAEHKPLKSILVCKVCLLYAFVLITGTVVGMEIPLVMRVLHREQAAFADLVARVLTFDYLGALAVSLLFPLLLAPRLGMARSALLFGILNAAVALLTARVFRRQLPRYPSLDRKSVVRERV